MGSVISRRKTNTPTASAPPSAHENQQPHVQQQPGQESQGQHEIKKESQPQSASTIIVKQPSENQHHDMQSASRHLNAIKDEVSALLQEDDEHIEDPMERERRAQIRENGGVLPNIYATDEQSAKMQEHPNIVWQSRFEVGVPLIDNQHKKLVQLLNNLNMAVNDYENNVANCSGDFVMLGSVLDDLLDYTSFHFKEEEQLMEKYGYPNTESHKEVHNRLVAKVMQVRYLFKQGQEDISHDVLEFLKEWLVRS
eukprot:GEZU01011377.1.p1 GENE.GEZU01011377.1~~GEZU01011377.1.p1  ORF type:complete len:253 (+),score=54.13 GEZU01011377.1:51-809(+)